MPAAISVIDSHPDYPRSDWRYEVENEDTNLGYWDWVVNSLQNDEKPVIGVHGRTLGAHRAVDVVLALAKIAPLNLSSITASDVSAVNSMLALARKAAAVYRK